MRFNFQRAYDRQSCQSCEQQNKRRLLPNLRSIKIQLDDGTTKRIKVAASTLRTMRKGA